MVSQSRLLYLVTDLGPFQRLYEICLYSALHHQGQTEDNNRDFSALEKTKGRDHLGCRGQRQSNPGDSLKDIRLLQDH